MKTQEKSINFKHQRLPITSTLLTGGSGANNASNSFPALRKPEKSLCNNSIPAQDRVADVQEEVLDKYRRRRTTLEIPIEGMVVHQCTRELTWALTRIPGVIRARVSLSTEIATVIVDPLITTMDQLWRAILDSGYRAPVLDKR